MAVYHALWPCKRTLSFLITPRKFSLSSLSSKQLSCKTKPMNYCKSQVSENPNIIIVLSRDICRPKFLLDIFLAHSTNPATQCKAQLACQVGSVLSTLFQEIAN